MAEPSPFEARGDFIDGDFAVPEPPSGELALTWREAKSGPDAAEWRLAVGKRGDESFESQVLLQTSASRASGISALHADGEDLIFSHTRVEKRAVRVLRLVR